MARFSKGQTVYYASANFAGTKDGKRIGAVIARIVDACGAKQVTFANRGFDSIYGRKQCSDCAVLFATPDEAFAYLRANHWPDGYATDVYSDAEPAPFDRLRAGTLPITWK